MLEKLSPQKRLVLATALSAVFFIGYEFFIGSKFKQEQNTTKVETVSQNHTSIVSKPSEANTSVTTAQPAQNSGVISKIHLKECDLTIASDGTISQVVMDGEKFKDEHGKQVKLFAELKTKPLSIKFADKGLEEASAKASYSASAASLDASVDAKTVTLTQQVLDINVTKVITFKPNGAYDVKITTSKDIPFFVTNGFRPNVLADSYAFKGALLIDSENTVKTIEDGGLKADQTLSSIGVVATVDRYYSSVLYSHKTQMNVTIVADIHQDPTPYIEAKKEIELGGYIGPKYVETLTSINPKLKGVVEYGFFTFLAKPMFAALEWMENVVGNWGWAIVILTILIRVVLFPLTYKGMVSMAKLKDLAPKLTELREKYKGEPQKLNVHMMDLYKKHGANPLGGCLPLLLQIPVFFAIYRVLLNAIELKGAPWILWIHDLSLMDQYYVLPLLMGATMFLQQKITPTNFTDPMQEKIFKYLPLVFTFFFLAFPAGLTLYWFINNLLSIGQQYLVNKMLEKQKELRKEHHD
jgi:YidC/Oxa1 family membrane protein insertase